jgi:hypothetical protein
MSLISSGNVRYFILFLSFLAILVLVGNLLLFNILLVYPHANHLLPQQYKGTLYSNKYTIRSGNADMIRVDRANTLESPFRSL